MYFVSPIFERSRVSRLRGLGDTSSTQVQVDSANVLNLGDDLRSAQARINALVQQMRNDPALAQAIGPGVTAQQAQLGDLTAKYVGAYTAIFGQPPAGLGVAPLLIAGAVAVVLASIAAALYVWHEKQDALEQQAQAQTLAEQNRGALITAAQQKQQDAWNAQQSGDTAAAADANAAAMALYQQAGVPGSSAATGPQTFTDWIKANWLTVSLIAAGIYIVPRVVER